MPECVKIEFGDFHFVHSLYNSLQFLFYSQISLKLILSYGHGLSGEILPIFIVIIIIIIILLLPLPVGENSILPIRDSC